MDSVNKERIEVFRSASLISKLPHATFQERDTHYLYAWGVDYACHNGILEKNSDRVLKEEEIDEAINYFSSKKLPFMWWSSSPLLETKGFQFGGILKGISLDISQSIPSQPKVSPDLRVKIIHSDTDMEAFSSLAADAFAMSKTAEKQWFTLNQSLMKKGSQIHFSAYLKGLLVGTATLSLSPSSSGIWNLATLPEYRKQGIGASLVHAAIIEAKKKQQTEVMAILMPKGLSWGLFTKMGFKEVSSFPFYVYGISADSLEK